MSREKKKTLLDASGSTAELDPVGARIELLKMANTLVYEFGKCEVVPGILLIEAFRNRHLRRGLLEGLRAVSKLQQPERQAV